MKGDVEEGEETEAKREKKAPLAMFKIPASIQKAMANDKLNQRLWGKLLSQQFSTQKDLVDSVEELLRSAWNLSPTRTHRPVWRPGQHLQSQL